MADTDVRDQISHIEADIEELAKTLEGCRKAILLSKVVIAVGGMWVLAVLFGAVRFDAATTTGAIAAVIGGIVVFGTNLATSRQTTTAIKAAEIHRAELIDMINPRTVGETGEGRQALGS